MCVAGWFRYIVYINIFYVTVFWFRCGSQADVLTLCVTYCRGYCVKTFEWSSVVTKICVVSLVFTIQGLSVMCKLFVNILKNTPLAQRVQNIALG